MYQQETIQAKQAKELLKALEPEVKKKKKKKMRQELKIALDQVEFKSQQTDPEMMENDMEIEVVERSLCTAVRPEPNKVEKKKKTKRRDKSRKDKSQAAKYKMSMTTTNSIFVPGHLESLPSPDKRSLKASIK